MVMKIMDVFGKARLNESPSEKEGKFLGHRRSVRILSSLNESPSEKEGKSGAIPAAGTHAIPSLNESPSEKEGKYCEVFILCTGDAVASMKVPPKRKGNSGRTKIPAVLSSPQ